MTFEELGLCPEVLRAVAEAGYVEPTPIQAQAIPVVLAGRDVMAGAQTGTGKTASFTLPMLHTLRVHANTSTSPARHPVRALILTPTRELAAQVYESVKTYGKYLPLRAAVVYGGVNMDPQIAELRKGVEILVATPGRLLDHLQNRSVMLSQVEFLVLDEADRMLDMGFMPDIRRILTHLPPKRRTLLFSATFPEEIKKLAREFLRDPVTIEVARRNTTAETVTQLAYRVANEQKRRVLVDIVQSRGLSQVLVFVNTKVGADRLTRELEKVGIAATAIHSDKTQQARMQALEDFKAGRVTVLVATDIAARGLDIDDLPCVVNYELPYNAEDYVHRIGRTGRAGAKGLAISLVSPEEKKLLAEIEKFIKRELPLEAPPPVEVGTGQGSRPRDERRAPAPPAIPSAPPRPAARKREIPALLLPPRHLAGDGD
ncbi:MAG: DEAD/DEAH box helicase [Burkholderiales bacterium]